jgi:hypothetical protein
MNKINAVGDSLHALIICKFALSIKVCVTCKGEADENTSVKPSSEQKCDQFLNSGAFCSYISRHFVGKSAQEVAED